MAKKFDQRRERRRYRKSRTQRLELLEPRLMLNADWQNPARPLDVNNDVAITTLDALLILNHLQRTRSAELPERTNRFEPYFDTTGDGEVTPLDALIILNALARNAEEWANGLPRVAGETEIAPAGFFSKPLTVLPGSAGQLVEIFTTLTIGEKEFNEFGLFVTDDPEGTVDGIDPSSQAYPDAVFGSNSRRVLYSKRDIFRTSRDVVLPGGRYVHVYVLQGMTRSDDPDAHIRVLEIGDSDLQVGWDERSIPFGGAESPPGYDDATVDLRIGQPFVANDPPAIHFIPDQTIPELVELSVQAIAVDANLPNDSLVYTFDSAPEGAILDAQTGLFRWLPTEAQGPGTYVVTIRVTDSEGAFDTESFSVHVREVNSPPVLEPIANRVLGPRAAVSFTALASDPDIPANLLTFSLDVGLLEGATIDPQNGLFNWVTPDVDTTTDFLFTVRVMDDGTPCLSALQSFTITVDPSLFEYRAPVIEPIDDQVVPELSELRLQVIATDDDFPYDPLTFSLDTAPPGATIDPISGWIDWTPTETQGPGNYTIEVRVANPAGAFSTVAFDVLVLEVNHAPTLAPIANRNVLSGGHVSFTAQASDPDLPANSLTFTLDPGAPADATIDPISGFFSWTAPIVETVTTFLLTARVRDDGTPSLDDARSFMITVNPPQPECPFDEGLTGWQVWESGGSESERGSVTTIGCSAVLGEGDSLRTELSRPFTLTADLRAIELRFESPQFDATALEDMQDAFEITVTNTAGELLTQPFRPGRTAAFNWSERSGPLAGDESWFTPATGDQPHALLINLSHLQPGTEVTVTARLINNDSDSGTSIVIRDVRLAPSPGETSPSFNVQAETMRSGEPLLIDRLEDISGSVSISYGATSYTPDRSQIITELVLNNIGDRTLVGDLLIAFDRFSELDTFALRPDGLLPDGRPYFDFTPFADGPLLPGQSTTTRELRFTNPAEHRFDFRITTLGRFNVSPGRFIGTPLTEIEAGRTYRYTATAIDGDGDQLAYSVVSGPESMTIDATSGELIWETSTDDVARHTVTLRATDPFGLFVEQTFAIDVVASLQNRPPIFISQPVTDAIASSGFEITTVAVGPSPSGIGIINGFSGPRLVSANAGDQTVSVHAGQNNDRFDDVTTISTGFPAAAGQLFDVGYSVDIGLPAFIGPFDSNSVLGLDQGDINGDGILDLVVLYSYDQPSVGDRYQLRIATMFGNGDGSFSEPQIIYQHSIGTNIYSARNLMLRDLNNNGYLDVIAVEQQSDPRLITLLNNGDGTFAEPIEQRFASPLNDFRIADIDEDGVLDLIGRTGFGATFDAVWLKGLGDGTFNEPTIIAPADGDAGTQTRSYDVLDLNGDGHLDFALLTGSFGTAALQIYHSDGTGNFTLAANLKPSVTFPYNWIRGGDFNGDGFPDLAYHDSWDGNLVTLLGDGSGVNFTKVESPATYDWLANYAGTDDPMDINGNGHLDLILGHSSGHATSPKVAINDGTGVFTLIEYTMVDFSGEINPFATGDIARGVMFGDYNGDGVLDFSYFTSGNDFNGVGIRLGTRPGEFGSTRAAPLPGTAPVGDALPGDFNGDGIIDLLDTATDTIALGNGDGTFAAPFPAVGIARPGGYGSVADFNLDGLDDVVATRANTHGSRYYVALANGDGSFTVSDDQLVEGSFYGYSSTLIADFNGDGYPDFMAKAGTERHIDVHLNDPENPGVFTRTFRHTLPFGSQGINVSSWDQSYAAADVTGNGIVDLIFAERDETTDNVIKIIVMAGDGTGNFSRYSELPLHPDAQSLGVHLGFFGPGDFSTGDLNGDGSIDLIANTTAGARVFLNDGTGNFIFTSQLMYPGTTQRGRDSWIVDFDQDGVLDFIQSGTEGGGPLIVRLGIGDGTFQAPQQIGVIAAVPGNISRNPFADIDGDGHLDFVHASGGIGNYGTNTIAAYAGRRDDLVDLIAVDLNGDGNEEILAVQEQMDRLQLFVGDNLGGLTRLPDLQTGRAPRAVAAADLNGDGQLELLTVNRASRSVSVFSGTVATGYTSTEFLVGGEGSPATGPIDIEVADIDGDGNMDVVVLDEQNEALWIFWGNGTTSLATPTAIALGDKPTRFVLEDATGDGELDAVITLAGSNRLMILPGIGAQSIGTPYYLELAGKPSDVAVLDLNSDGKPDLAITLENLNVVSVYYGLGNNQFTRPQQIAVGASPTRVVKTDADQDGRLDLVVVNSGDDTVSVIYNRFDPNEVYRYDSEAIDPDDDPIVYSIVDGPGGLIMNSETGELLWAASPDQVGVHEVTIAADDGRGGVATQSFKIAVEPARENSAPIIASRPADQIGSNERFSYTVHAIDADNHPLRFSLVDGPEGASIHPTTGELIWDGRASAVNFGNAGQFGIVEVPYRPSLKPESITAEGWFELTGLPRYNALINDQVYVGIHETDQSFIAHITLEGEALQFFVPLRPKANQWYHIALTYDAATGEAKLFIDGQLAGSATASEPKPLNTTAGVTRVGSPGVATQARVDNYRIWNYARSQAEIAEGLTRQYKGDPRLVLDFRFFDQPNTLSVQDHSIYGNTGYLTSNGGLPQPTRGLTDTGSHNFLVRVEDGRGGSDTQAFTLNVAPELRGNIVGRLFDDLNGNGLKDVDEPGLEGWHLFIDFNGNGYPDPHEPQALTDVNGNYRFDGLLPGDYGVRVSPVAGYETPAEFNATVVPETQAELDPLSAAIHDLAVDQLALSQIRGQLKTENGDAVAYWKAYADLNDNGTRDEDEPLAMTDHWGNYAIAGLAAGTYKVRTERPAGWIDDTDREGLTVTLAADEIATGNDFVLRPTNTSVTGGVHFVTTPAKTIEARQTFTYASVAVGLFEESIRYDLSLAPDGMTIDPATGLVAWRPTIGQVGEHLAILRATSASGSNALQDFTIHVAAPNTAPVLVGVQVQQPLGARREFPAAYVGRTYAVDLVAQDAEGQAITYDMIDFPGTATLDATTGALRWLPAAVDVGTVDFTIELTDAEGATSTHTFTVDVLNDQPATTPLNITLPRTQVGLGQDYLAQVLGSDALGRPLSWSLQSGPAGMTVSSRGTLRWTPGNSDLGSHSVVLQATDADGTFETTSFDLQVVGRPVNSAPQITSTPLTSTVIGGEYRYDVQFHDADSDTVAFALLESPVGMSIHPSLGTIRWTPTDDQRGESTVSIQVVDPDGRTDTQTYKLKVSRFGGPPNIRSIPPTEAAVGTGYLYSVLARDAEGDPLTYRLLAAPTGMTITPTTGEIAWTPTTEQLGAQEVVIEVSDGVGGAVTQAFAIRVRDGLPNQPPQITSSAPRFAVVGAAYQYSLIATDPEGTLLSYSLGQAPEGLTIDPQSGQVSWTPAAGQAGQSVVTLIVTDEGGASAVESFELDVLAENSPPVISSTAPSEVMSGVVFTYQVLASDANLDPLTYTLTAGPVGATIDAFGKINWPTTGQALGDHEFTFEVSDPRGGVATESFTLSIVADTEPPRLSLIERPSDSNRNVLPWDGPFVVYVRAIDNVGIASLTLTANGRDIPLDAAGTATFTFEDWTFQRINATATAIDTSGNVTTRTISFDYDFPEGWSGAGTEDIPTAIISSPTDTQTVFGMVSITGTAAHENFAAYKLSYRRVDETSYTEFLQSDTPVTGGELGVWDTSLLINDEYVIRLEVASNAGVVNVVEHNVGVSGGMKLGNFRLSFNDLVLPVAGIPLQINRVYDTLQADRQGDFGYGWRLEYRDTDLRVGMPKSGLEDIGIHAAFRPGIKVYMNLPGEGRVGFTFDPDIRVLPGLGNNLVLARPRFTSDAGVSATLSAGTSGYLLVNEYGELYSSGGIPYNPASNDFGGAYVVTTRDGTQYRIDGNTGHMQSVTDQNGNRLLFTEAGIASADGGSRLTFVRDARGRIINIIDPAGNRQQYRYDTSGNLINVSDREGNTTVLTYSDSTAHYLESITDPLGRTGTRSIYGPDGRLTTTLDVNGFATNYSYDLANSVAVRTDALGNPTIVEYDSRGNVVAITDTLGNVTRMRYDASNNMRSTTDALGNTTQFQYNASGDLIAMIDAMGHRTDSTVNGMGRPLATTDALGNRSTFEYDARGNLIASTDTRGNTTRYEVDSRGNVTAIISPTGVRRSSTYDARGNVLSQTDGRGNVTTYQYDANGNLVSKASQVTGPEGTQTITVTSTYDANGNRLTTTDELGQTRSFSYDAAGNQVGVTDEAGEQITIAYDSSNLLQSVIRPSGSSTQLTYNAVGSRTRTTINGTTTWQEYDAVGRLVATIYADDTPGDLSDNPRRTYEYDARGREIANIDELGHRTQFFHDTLGRLIRTINPLGAVAMYSYDAVGNRTEQQDALGRRTAMAFDEAGNLERVTYADGSTVSYAYNSLGRVVRITDELGRVTQFAYDSDGNLQLVIDPAGGKTEYAYDEAGNLTKATDAAGRSTHYEYDALGRRTASVTPLGFRSVTEFDEVGNPVQVTDADGRVNRNFFDAEGRVTRRELHDGQVVQFAYDISGHLVSMVDATGTTNMSYDSQGRLLQRVFGDGRAMSYAYDAAGNLVTTNMPGETLGYTYDAVGGLIAVESSTAGSTTYQYDQNQNLVSTRFSDGTHETRVYDVRDRLLAQSTFDATNSLLQQMAHVVLANGLIATTMETGVVERVVNYTYDDLNRLLTESVSGTSPRTTAYAYDAAGNRLQKFDSIEGTTLSTYDLQDRLISSDRDGQTTNYEYDRSGNLISMATGSDVSSYSYTADGKLAFANVLRDGVAEVVSYQYTGDGLRVSRTSDGVQTRYLVDSNRQYTEIAQEYSASGQLLKQYVYGHQIISASYAGEDFVLHTDHLGSVRFVTANGLVSGTATMDSFGNIIESSGNAADLPGFAGRNRDSVTGWVDMRARDYNTGTGRFTTSDPFPAQYDLPGTLHRYAFALNNPANFTDPSGYFTLAEQLTSTGLGTDLMKTYSKNLGKLFLTAVRISLCAIEPGQQLRTMGARLIEQGVPRGEELYERGTEMLASGLTELQSAIKEAYKNIANDLKKGMKSKYDSLGKPAAKPQAKSWLQEMEDHFKSERDKYLKMGVKEKFKAGQEFVEKLRGYVTDISIMLESGDPCEMAKVVEKRGAAMLDKFFK